MGILKKKITGKDLLVFTWVLFGAQAGTERRSTTKPTEMICILLNRIQTQNIFRRRDAFFYTLESTRQ